MSNSSGVEFIDENASGDTGASLYQVKRLPTEKVPKIISLITKMGVPEKYAEYVAFGLLLTILASSAFFAFSSNTPKVKKMSQAEIREMVKLMKLPGDGTQ